MQTINLTAKAMALAVALAMTAPCLAQDGYLDVFMARVKPDKRAEFDAINKRMAGINKQSGGDEWIATEVMYGEGNTIYFTSVRAGYADVEKGMAAFMGALTKAGQMGLMQGFNNTLIGTRSEMRRRRNDLSANPIGDPAALMKKVGESRYLRTLVTRVRPGHVAEYEENLKEIQAAFQKQGRMMLVSQSVAGTVGAVYYASTLAKSLGEFDAQPTSARQMLSDDAYRKYVEVLGRAVLGTETLILRYVPELSNPPAAVVAVDPGFWSPKAAAPAKVKPAEPKP